MTIKEFVDAYKAKKFMNTKTGVDEKSEWLRNELEIKTYIPFRQKRQIAEAVVEANITEVDGIKKSDAINQYIGFIVAMLTAHTNLEFSQDPVADYDILAASGLLPQIIAEFQESYSECDVILKMQLAMELEDNNINVLVGKFLNGILNKLDGVGEALKGKLDGFDLQSVLGDFNKEELNKLSGFLDKIK